MTLTEAELTSWGERVGREAGPPLFLALRGDLGAGKSVLARAVARGAGVRQVMPSPTFNLLYRYRGDGGVEVVHIDLYRLEQQDDVWELGWRELGGDREIVLVEWPERAESLLPSDRWDVRLERAGESLRTLGLTPRGAPPPLPEP
jgi:tRNA threonylcarbamoyladenosine biosynthesis protein TsaE